MEFSFIYGISELLQYTSKFLKVMSDCNNDLNRLYV